MKHIISKLNKLSIPMKRISAIGIAVCLLSLIFIPLSSVISIAASDNLVQNGTFDSDLSHWKTWENKDVTANEAVWSDGQLQIVAWKAVYQTIDVDKNTNYNFYFVGNRFAATQGTLDYSVTGLDDSSPLVSSSLTLDAWAYSDIPVLCFNSGENTKIRLRFYSAGVFRIDDVYVSKVSELKNGDMEIDDLSSWRAFEGISRVSSSGKKQNGAYSLSTTLNGTSLYHTGVQLTPNTEYTLSYWAYNDSNVPQVAHTTSVCAGDSARTILASKNYLIDGADKGKTFKVIFKTDATGIVTFDFALASKNTLLLDDVSIKLKTEDDKEDEEAEELPQVSVELVSNGTFDEDLDSWTDISGNKLVEEKVNWADGYLQINPWSAAYQTVKVQQNTWYRFSFRGYRYYSTTGSLDYKLTGLADGKEILSKTLTLDGWKTKDVPAFYFNSGVNTEIQIRFYSKTVYRIDNVSLKNVIDGIENGDFESDDIATWSTSGDISRVKSSEFKPEGEYALSAAMNNNYLYCSNIYLKPDTKYTLTYYIHNPKYLRTVEHTAFVYNGSDSSGKVIAQKHFAVTDLFSSKVCTIDFTTGSDRIVTFGFYVPDSINFIIDDVVIKKSNDEAVKNGGFSDNISAWTNENGATLTDSEAVWNNGYLKFVPNNTVCQKVTLEKNCWYKFVFKGNLNTNTTGAVDYFVTDIKNSKNVVEGSKTLKAFASGNVEVTFYSGDSEKFNIKFFSSTVFRIDNVSITKCYGISNGNFEEEDVTSWESVGTVERSKTDGFNGGSNALKAYLNYGEIVQKNIILEPDTDYVLSYKTYNGSSDASLSHIVTLYSDEEMQDVPLARVQNFVSSFSSASYSVTFKTDETGMMTLSFYMPSTNYLWLDDIEITKLLQKDIPTNSAEIKQYISDTPYEDEYTENLISCGDFETTPDKDASWNKDSFMENSSVTIDTTQAYSGNNSLKFTGYKTVSTAYMTFDVKPNTLYTFGAYVMGGYLDDEHNGKITFGFIDSSETYIPFSADAQKYASLVSYSTSCARDMKWHRRSFDVFTGNSDKVTFAVKGYCAEMWFDDIMFAETSTCSANKPAIKYVEPVVSNGKNSNPSCNQKDNLFRSLTEDNAQYFLDTNVARGVVSLKSDPRNPDNTVLSYDPISNISKSYYTRKIDVNKNTNYTFSVFFRSDKMGEVNFGFKAFDGERYKQQQILYVGAPDDIGNWKFITFDFNTNDAQSIFFYIQDCGGSMFIDDICLFESDKGIALDYNKQIADMNSKLSKLVTDEDNDNSNSSDSDYEYEYEYFYEEDDTSEDTVKKSKYVDELIDKHTGIKVYFDDGKKIFYKIRLYTSSLSAKEIGNTAIEIFDGDTLKGYSIVLKMDGKEIRPGGKITVEIPVPKEMNYKKCQLYRIADNGKITRMKAKIDKNNFTFKTDHLGKFLIVESNDTVDYTIWIILGAVAILLIAAGTVLTVILVKKSKEKID